MDYKKLNGMKEISSEYSWMPSHKDRWIIEIFSHYDDIFSFTQRQRSIGSDFDSLRKECVSGNFIPGLIYLKFLLVSSLNHPRTLSTTFKANWQ